MCIRDSVSTASNFARNDATTPASTATTTSSPMKFHMKRLFIGAPLALGHRESFAVYSLRAGYPECHVIRARVAAFARTDPQTASLPQEVERVAAGAHSPYRVSSGCHAQGHLPRRPARRSP